jgi:VPDSG-CTERM motif
MKNKLLIAGAVAAFVAFGITVQAVPITGEIGFSGTNLTFTANSVTFIGSASVDTGAAGPSGSWAPTAGASPVTFTSITSFTPLAPSPVSPLWSFVSGGLTYQFNLTSLTVVADIPGTILALTGLGTATISGGVFDPTPATWSLTATAGGPINFEFDSGNTAVPDGGMTVTLLGAALSGLALFRKKVMA